MITYAKVGGPPANWQDLDIKNLDTGKPVRECVEINTEDGWALVYAHDDDGTLIIRDDEIVKKRIEGHFQISERSRANA